METTDIRKQIYKIIEQYAPDCSEPKKLCSSIEDIVDDLAQSKVENMAYEPVLPTIFTKENVIAAVKDIRKEEDYHNDQAIFCNDHNFKLEETLHRQLENKLRRICHQLQNRFELGYISR